MESQTAESQLIAGLLVILQDCYVNREALVKQINRMAHKQKITAWQRAEILKCLPHSDVAERATAE